MFHEATVSIRQLTSYRDDARKLGFELTRFQRKSKQTKVQSEQESAAGMRALVPIAAVQNQRQRINPNHQIHEAADPEQKSQKKQTLQSNHRHRRSIATIIIKNQQYLKLIRAAKELIQNSHPNPAKLKPKKQMTQTQIEQTLREALRTSYSTPSPSPSLSGPQAHPSPSPQA
jgi:hypothetical protein